MPGHAASLQRDRPIPAGTWRGAQGDQSYSQYRAGVQGQQSHSPYRPGPQGQQSHSPYRPGPMHRGPGDDAGRQWGSQGYGAGQKVHVLLC